MNATKLNDNNSTKRRLRALVFCLLLISLATPLVAWAQQSEKIPRIGILRLPSQPDPLLDAFKRRLAELGYIEGKNILIEYRSAEGREDRLPKLADDLVALGVDVIVGGSTAAA